MKIRAIIPAAGVKVRIRKTHYNPKGWMEGMEATVVERCNPSSFFKIRDKRGREVTVPMGVIDAGWQYEIEEGIWADESHPTVLEYLRELLRKELGYFKKNPKPQEASYREAYTVGMKTRLEKNGIQSEEVRAA